MEICSTPSVPLLAIYSSTPINITSQLKIHGVILFQ